MNRIVHVFDNGIKVYDDHLLPIQRDRYRKCNVHEAEEEDIFTELLQTIPSDGCYVNIGSAIGYYPLLAKKLAPGLTVHAVEPLERHRAFFMENFALNGLKHSSFTIHNEGISSSEGRAEFIDKGYASLIRGDSTYKQTKNIKSTYTRYVKGLLSRTGLRKPVVVKTIRTKTLDNLCMEIGGGIDLCQMDVQGLELDVLKGAQHTLKTGNVKTFLIGTHSHKLHESCIKVLIANGYIVEYNNFNTKDQPDGILVASKDCQRLSAQNKN